MTVDVICGVARERCVNGGVMSRAVPRTLARTEVKMHFKLSLPKAALFLSFGARCEARAHGTSHSTNQRVLRGKN